MDYELAPADVPGELASWGVRALGAIADAVIAGIVVYAVARLGSIRGRTSYVAVDAAIVFGYSVPLIGLWGRTLGMALFGLEAVDALEGESPVGLVKAGIRSLTAGVLKFLVIGAIADLLWPLWDPRNQTLHDKAAGTVVLRR
jgi:uncharacterized RDD family membrane protein YckC